MSCPPQPQNQDVVLGGQLPAPTAAMVLGGLEGVRQQLTSNNAAHRARALNALPNYGAKGLELLVAALQDEARVVQKMAYTLLRRRSEPQVKQALKNYDVYRLYECLFTLHGHTDTVSVVALSPNGKLAASASTDFTIRVWDLAAREELMRIQDWATAIAFHPDNRTFTIHSFNHILKSWDSRTGQQIEPEAQQWFEDMPRLRQIPSVMTSGGKYLISGSQNTIKIWNLQAGREVCLLRGHTSLVTSVAVLPKRRILISGSSDRTLRVWGIA